jgi:hypothetical protein
LTVIKTYSTGGFGDFFIVYLKLLDDIRAGHKIDHLHIESNEIVPGLIQEFMEFSRWSIEPSGGHDITVASRCIPEYSKTIKGGTWEGREPRNTHCLGEYNYPGKDSGIKQPWMPHYSDPSADSRYYKRITIQVSAGAKSDRVWKFDVFSLQKILTALGFEVFLIGNDSRYERGEANNFVGYPLSHTLSIMDSCRCHIGLSGFLTYYSLSRGAWNVHLPESKEHVKHYIHPEWENFRMNLEVGSIAEILGKLKNHGII